MLRFFETLENFDFDQGDVQGETPLIKAIVGKDLDIVKFLVSKGVRLSFSDQAVKPSWNPVYVAACLGTQETLEYLLGLGLDPNEETSMQRTALTKACWMGREENVRVLLAHPDIKIDFQANGQRTALHVASWGKYGGLYGYKLGIQPCDSPECVKLLLEAGANHEIIDNAGRTALTVAAQTGGKRSIPILLDHGADINAVSTYGQTAILSCFYYGLVSTAKALLYYPGKHVDVSRREVTMRTATFEKQVRETEPLEISTVRDHFKILKFVISDEEKLRGLGYESITVGVHNFDRLVSQALESKAFKCLAVLLEYYQNRLRSHQIDLVTVLAKGITLHQAPVEIIVKLYECIRPSGEEEPFNQV